MSTVSFESAEEKVFSETLQYDCTEPCIKIEYNSIDCCTEKAALVSVEGVDQLWIPFSCLRNDGNSLYVLEWFYNKYLQ